MSSPSAHTLPDTNVIPAHYWDLNYYTMKKWSWNGLNVEKFPLLFLGIKNNKTIKKKKSKAPQANKICVSQHYENLPLMLLLN